MEDSNQLVGDIAAIYWEGATVTQEQMLYCLFRHSATQLIRDLVVRAGDRLSSLGPRYLYLVQALNLCFLFIYPSASADELPHN